MPKPKSNPNSFKKGRQKTGGRKAGTFNKITVAVKDVIAMAAKRIGGLDRLVKWINESPENERLFWSQMYMKRLPLQINTKIERTDKVIYSYCVTNFCAATVLRLERCNMDIAAGF